MTMQARRQGKLRITTPRPPQRARAGERLMPSDTPAGGHKPFWLARYTHTIFFFAAVFTRGWHLSRHSGADRRLS